MKKNKTTTDLMIPLVLIAMIFVGYVVFVFAQERCKDNVWPIPPPALLKFGPYYLRTDQGALYIGQTYEHRNEGPWVGNMTLLFIDGKEATLLFHYPEGAGRNFKIHSCKGFLPRAIDKGTGK